MAKSISDLVRRNTLLNLNINLHWRVVWWGDTGSLWRCFLSAPIVLPRLASVGDEPRPLYSRIIATSTSNDKNEMYT